MWSLRAVLVALTLCSTSVTAQSLQDWQWRHRVVVVKSPPAEKLAELLEASQTDQQDLAERKLRVLILQKDRLQEIYRGELITHNWPQLRQQLAQRLKGQRSDVLLIGLDGGDKEAYLWAEFDLAKVFAAIDLMPMRQAELQPEP